MQFVLVVLVVGCRCLRQQVAHVVQERRGHERLVRMGPFGQLGTLQRMLQGGHPLRMQAAVGALAAGQEQGLDAFDDGGAQRIVHGYFLQEGQIRRRRRREDSRSITETVATSISSTAAVSAYWKPRITSHSTMPMPPAPTMPTTEADRTLASKR